MTGIERGFARRIADRSVDQPSGILNTFEYPTPRSDLSALSVIDLATELLARLAHGETFERDKDIVLGGQLQDLLQSRLDVNWNRFGARRLFDVTRPILDHAPPSTFQGGTIVDLGCGSLNPFAFSFAFLMLGAQRAYAVDLEPVQDLSRAVRALATAAGWLLIDPVRILGRHAIDPASVLANLAGFDLARLAAGDADGIAADRLFYHLESIYDLSIPDGEADIVSSVSVLEHVDRIDDTLDTLYRITKPGGVGYHVVDFVDHRTYGGEVTSPFEFLKEPKSAPIVHGCNRIRCSQLAALFESHGFVVERVDPSRTEPLTEEEHAQFAEPYRSMRPDELKILCANFFVRKA